MSRFSDDDRRRLLGAADLLESDRDGEVVAAARAMGRVLRKAGLKPAVVFSAGLDALLTIASTRPGRSGLPEPVTLTRSHQRNAMECQAFPELLTEWERGFVASVVDKRHLSAKEEGILRDILAKVRRCR